jgi:hypothetical protein
MPALAATAQRELLGVSQMRIGLTTFLGAALLVALPCLSEAQTPASTGAVDVAQLQQTVRALTTRAEIAESAVRALNEKQTATYWSAAAAIVAALLVAGFAVVNQRAQAALERQLTAEQGLQARLLKAIELVMQSRNLYEAEIRLANLKPFIPDDARNQLEAVLKGEAVPGKSGFSGPEWTDLRVRMAETMAAKATSPGEVLQIWRYLLPGKRSVTEVTWPPSGVVPN